MNRFPSKPRHTGLLKTPACVAALALGAGCASVAVTDDAIQQRTATSLGLTPGSFTVSNRRDDAVRTDYVVKTNAGKTYNCYVTGGIAVTGRVVSDAICTPLAGQGTNATAVPTPGPATNCNALLRAAGKCS